MFRALYRPHPHPLNAALAGLPALAAPYPSSSSMKVAGGFIGRILWLKLANYVRYFYVLMKTGKRVGLHRTKLYP